VNTQKYELMGFFLLICMSFSFLFIIYLRVARGGPNDGVILSVTPIGAH